MASRGKASRDGGQTRAGVGDNPAAASSRFGR